MENFKIAKCISLCGVKKTRSYQRDDDNNARTTLDIWLMLGNFSAYKFPRTQQVSSAFWTAVWERHAKNAPPHHAQPTYAPIETN